MATLSKEPPSSLGIVLSRL